MFGLPGQAAATWEQSLLRALALGPEHLSLYSLTVEQGTPLADWVRRGRVAEPDDDLAADLYLAATEILARHGYVQYEISNWAKDQGGALASVAQPSAACRHNLVYWHDEAYLGFGVGHTAMPRTTAGGTCDLCRIISGASNRVRRLPAARNPSSRPWPWARS